MFKGDRASRSAPRSSRGWRPARAAGAHPHAGRAEGRARTRGARGRREAVRQLLRRLSSARRQRRRQPVSAARLDPLGLGQQVTAHLARASTAFRARSRSRAGSSTASCRPHAFLTDEQVSQLLTFLRQNFGNHGNAVKRERTSRRCGRGHLVVRSLRRRVALTSTVSARLASNRRTVSLPSTIDGTRQHTIANGLAGSAPIYLVRQSRHDAELTRGDRSASRAARRISSAKGSRSRTQTPPAGARLAA